MDQLIFITLSRCVPVPLERVDVSVTVHGFLANVDASLTYHNAGSTAVDVVFVYHVDDNGAVYKCEAEMDGRKIKAEIQEKVQAELTYEEATARGMTSVLMEEDCSSRDIFRCKLGNLPSNSDAKLQFSFVTELVQKTDGSLKFVLPTVLNPRYYSEGDDKETRFDLFARNSCQYMLDFEATVVSKHGISEVWSNTDKLVTTVMPEDCNTMTIGLAEEFTPDHSLSFSVLYRDTHRPQATLEKGRTDCPGSLLEMDILMLSFYPDLSITTELVKSEFIFIIDRSASMHGEPMLNAQETLLFFLKSLPVGSYFNVISFGSSCEALFPQSVRYGPSSLQKAMELQATLTANMVGTELLKPLSLVYGGKPQPGYTRQMFLLTDGDVFNIADIVSLVRRNAPENRVFTVGIGDAVSLPLVRNIARAGRGQVELVTGSDNLQEKVMKLLKQAMQPAVTDLVIDFQLPAGLAVAHRIPQDMPDIFSGQRCTFYGFLTGEMSSDTSTVGKATMSGNIGGKTFTHTMTFDVIGDAVMTPGHFVHRRAMKTIVDDLEDQETDCGANRKREIIVASVAGNIISKYTSFVGIDPEMSERIYEPIRKVIQFVAMDTAKNEKLHPAVKTERLLPRWQMFNPEIKCQTRSTLSRELDVRFSQHKDPVCVRDRDNMDVYGGHQTRDSSSPTRPISKNCLPRCSCFSWMFPSPRTKSMDEGLENRSTCGVEDVTFSVGDHDDVTATPISTVAAKASTMVALQEYDGSWSLTPEFAAVVDTTEDTLPVKTLSVEEKVWATSLAICWLTLKCPEERPVWEMVVNKARDWLSKQLGGPEEVDNLLKEAEGIVFTDSAKCM
ncbi:von Willebrand factor A domain-containing protein 5A-like [Haliotis rubra]|uniref:von Willebrand factor A domain-containing protein 5A-like n=1 Tax=Haliotis rubra TaxID=36100 RepID=UPI001EE63445|nr:von Willebrand factor A domain-containing protein 5A-like [Haliotis rubra]